MHALLQPNKLIIMWIISHQLKLILAHLSFKTIIYHLLISVKTKNKYPTHLSLQKFSSAMSNNKISFNNRKILTYCRLKRMTFCLGNTQKEIAKLMILTFTCTIWIKLVWSKGEIS